MTTALYLILSAALIGAGMGIIWRDVRNKSRAASGSFTAERRRRQFADPDVEIKIAQGPEPALALDTLAPLFLAGSRSPTEMLAKATPRDGTSPSATNATPTPPPALPASAGIGAGANQ